MCEVMKMCPQGGASIRVAEVGGVERDCNLEDFRSLGDFTENKERSLSCGRGCSMVSYGSDP